MKKEKIFKNYIKYMSAKAKGFKKFFPLVFFCSLCLSVLSICIAIFSKQLIDNLLTMDKLIILKVVLISISAYLFGAILGFFTSYLEKYIIDKLKTKLQLSFYDNMQRSEFVFFSNLSSSDVYYRMFTDIGVMVEFYLNLLISLPIKLIVLIITCSIMFIWSYQLTLAIIGLVMLQVVVMLIFRSPIKKHTEKVLTNEQILIAKINEDVLKSDLSRSLALEEYNYLNIQLYFETSRKSRLKNAKINLLYSAIIGFASQIINISLLLLGIYYVANSVLTIGTLMAISMLAGHLSQPINDFLQTLLSYQTMVVSYKRFNEFDSCIDHNYQIGTLKFNNGDISIKDLTFSYGANSVIAYPNMIIHKGKITYLQGGNGSGKTTLVRLLSRSLLPLSGSINIDTVNIGEFDYSSYRTNVIALNSEPILLNKTFRENICTGLSYSDEDISNTIDACALNDIVEKLENGIDTELGLSKVGLSQGEKQKLALARVLIRKPSVLILDEPLSHIDIKSCEEILATLSKYNKEYNATILIISHDDRVVGISDFIEKLTD
ncbi:MAG: ATP-binding cassette domain-containing protein [Clostridia bacterium]|nr:ATP-binding cassette domain-containing protein [Clostridia bacterium]